MRASTAVAAGAAILLVSAASSAVRAEECGLKLVASVDLRLEAESLSPLLPVTLSGHPTYMLLDTGSVFSMISAKAVDALSLTRKRSNVEIFDVARDSSRDYVTTPLTLGRLTTDHFDLVVEPESMRIGRSPLDEGIIGPDILTRFDVDIDFGTGKLNFISPEHCEGKVVYWPTNVVAVVPMTVFLSGHIAIPVKLDGKIQNALVDTGASGSTLTTEIAESDYDLRLGTDDVPANGTLQGHSTQTVYRHVFKTLEFEGVTITNPRIEIIPNPTRSLVEEAATPHVGSHIANAGLDETKINMLIGMNVLRHLHIYIAYHEHNLYITPAGTPAVPTP
jgi:predicted aspartyl protease